jgi:hypothetical protein
MISGPGSIKHFQLSRQRVAQDQDLVFLREPDIDPTAILIHPT